MKFKIYLIILSSFLVLFAHSSDTTSVATQASNAPSLKKADQAFTLQQYALAYNQYIKALQADAQNPNLNFKVALCNLYLLHQPLKSIALLKTALNNYSNKYRFYDDKQKASSQDAFYFLGKAMLYHGQIDSAMQYFVYYQDIQRVDLPLDASRQLKMCINAKQLMKKPRQLIVSELGSPVNSQYDESHPVISLDNKVLFFASRRPDKADSETSLSDNDIYYALVNSNGSWSAPTPFGFNTELDEEPVALSSNGNTLYLRKANKKGLGDIYYSEKMDDKWTAPKKMKGVNSSADENAISVSSDGSMAVVSSNRPGGEGGYDLYSAKGKGGNFSGLKNLGNNVNTELDEVSPFIFPNGKRVYFSTNGNTEYGMGGFDIFFTEPDSNGKAWSKSFTMGYPINRSGNEMDYVLGSQAKTLYTAISKNGDLDIFDIVAGDFKEDVQEQIVEIIGTSETQTVEVVEVEKEKLVEVDKEIEVSRVEEIEKEVEKNVGYVNADDAKKLDKIVAIQKEEVEVQNIVETEKIIYTNQTQKVIDSLNGIAAETKQEITTNTVNNDKPIDNTVTTNVSINTNNTAEQNKAINTTVLQSATSQPTVGITTTDKELSDVLSEQKITKPVVYTVRANESLESIAKQYNVSTDDLRKWNKLKSNTVVSGSGLIVGFEYDKDLQHALAMEQLDASGISRTDRDAIIQKIKDDLAKEMSEKRSTIFKTFYFEFNSDNLELTNSELEVLVGFLKEHKEVNVEIVGHTDNIGAWETNFWVSRQRAKSLFDFLISKKIASNRMIFNGKGSVEPVASNSTIVGRSQNRRVEIVLIQ